MTCVVPDEPLKIWMAPSDPSGATTVTAMSCPAWKFITDVSVHGILDGQIVRYPAACGWVTVTVAATAATPESGTPPLPATCTVAVAMDASAPWICRPSRGSTMRSGATVTRVPGSGVAAAAVPEAAVAVSVTAAAPATLTASASVAHRRNESIHRCHIETPYDGELRCDCPASGSLAGEVALRCRLAVLTSP